MAPGNTWPEPEHHGRIIRVCLFSSWVNQKPEDFEKPLLLRHNLNGLYITIFSQVSSTHKSGDNTSLMMNFEEKDTDTLQSNVDAQVRRVAARLREEREKARISQMDLSLQAGLSQNQVFCIETGKRVPNLLTILKLCGALGISPATLFINDDKERAKDKKLVMDVISKYM